MYVNSLLVTLNSRHRVRDAGEIRTRATFSVPLTYLQRSETSNGNADSSNDSMVGRAVSGVLPAAGGSAIIDIFPPVKAGEVHGNV